MGKVEDDAMRARPWKRQEIVRRGDRVNTAYHPSRRRVFESQTDASRPGRRISGAFPMQISEANFSAAKAVSARGPRRPRGGAFRLTTGSD
jgi:hypothetical protein